MKRVIRSLIGKIVMICFVSHLAGAVPEFRTAESFSNPLVPDCPDPVLFFADGCWFSSGTDGKAITLRKSDTIAGLKDAGKSVVFTPPAGSDFADQLWAPEFYHFDRRWYCYFTASNGDFHRHRMFVLRSKSDSPAGEWEMLGPLTTPEDGWAIDGTIFRAKGKSYFIYAGVENNREILKIAPMESPVKLGRERAVIARPRPGEGNINEGPCQLHTAGGNFLLYSINPCSSDDYAVLAMELVGEDPMSPGSWKVLPEPVLTKSEKAFGPGHCSVVPDGKGKWLIVFHAWDAPEAGRKSSERRNMWVQPLLLDGHARPVPQHPVSPVSFSLK